jgi:hypothetical protein
LVNLEKCQVAAFDPETLNVLRSTLDETWASLRPEERARSSKTMLAVRIIEIAAAGERDPVRLRNLALADAVRPALRF